MGVEGHGTGLFRLFRRGGRRGGGGGSGRRGGRSSPGGRRRGGGVGRGRGRRGAIEVAVEILVRDGDITWTFVTWIIWTYIHIYIVKREVEE